ncbi:MAG: hypothetical protein ACP5KZ_08810 [bacterium]
MANEKQDRKLKGIIPLLGDSWRNFRSHFIPLFAIYSLPVLSTILFLTLFLLLSHTSFRFSFFFSLLKALIYIALFLLFASSIVAIIYRLGEKSSVGEAYRKGKKILLPTVWLFFLLFALISGGFLLLFVPGIVFLTWFILSPFALVLEERKGVQALGRSKYLVKGSFLRILPHLILLVVICGTLGIFIPYLLFHQVPDLDLAMYLGITTSLFLSLFYLPFSLVYSHSIFQTFSSLKTEPYSAKVSLRKPSYLVPAFLGSVVLALLLVVSFLNIFWGRDIPPINDSELRLSKIEIPKEQNALYPLMEGAKRLHIENLQVSAPPEKYQFYRALYDAMLKGERLDTKEAREWLERNEEALKYVERALKLPYLQLPQVADPAKFTPTTLFPELSKLRELARWCVIKGNYLLVQGRDRSAFDWYLKTLSLGQMVENSPRPAGLIQYLVGRAIKEIALEAMRNAIAKSHLSPSELKFYVKELEKFGNRWEAIKRVYKMEYTLTINCIDQMGGKPLILTSQSDGQEQVCHPEAFLKYAFLPNLTKKLFYDRYRLLIENVGKVYKDVKLPKAKKVKLFLFTRNFLGEEAYSLMEPILDRVALKQYYLEKFSLGATDILLALKAYKEAKGDLPESLSSLVPAYLSRVPTDPFDGEPLRYSREKRIIYCVGEKLVDMGGGPRTRTRPTPWGSKVEEVRMSEMDNPMIEINF